jgi:tetratricopeptide (TPR) repeat protein
VQLTTRDLNHLAKEQKRKGNYRRAKELYYEILTIDGPDNAIYYNLAKVCYLNNDLGEAISSYLRALDIEAYQGAIGYRSDPATRRTLDATFSVLPSDLLNFMDQTSPQARFILTDPFTVLHLGHTLVDLNPKIQKTQEHISYIEQYRKGIAGQGNETHIRSVEESYSLVGILFALRNLNWPVDGQPDDLYIDARQMDFQALQYFTFPR